MPVTARTEYDIVTASASSDYFVTGGTLPLHAASYVVRQADEDLLQAILDGAFAYVLNTRQMGKSSLMIRTVARLRQIGYTVAVLDLTSIGHNVSVEQWYNGLLMTLSEQVDREDEMEDWWNENEEVGPMQRFFGAIRQVLLGSHAGNVAIFIDEIDAVRSLPFSSDEFFAGIRACFNQRTADPNLERLTFTLIGSATPAELVAAPHLSPFNIGRRIELADFTAFEASPLGAAMGRTGSALLMRVLHWSGGHPYLTQRLCRELAARRATTTRDVDQLCETLFFTPAACDRDDNLAFVRNRLLKEQQHSPEAILHLYGQILKKKPVHDDERNPLCAVLKLSGIAKPAPNGHMVVRNRIYERVFDRSWVEENTSADEIRRQRLAAERARNQTLFYSGGVVLVLVGLLWQMIVSLIQAGRERDRAVAFAYAANINLAHEELHRNPTKVRELLNDTPPAVRGLEWDYLDSFCPQADIPLSVHTKEILAVAIAPGGTRAVTASADGTALLWYLDHRPVSTRTLAQGFYEMTTVAFSPDEKYIAVGGKDKNIQVFDAHSLNRVASMSHTAAVNSIAFTPDSHALLTADESGVLYRWDFRARMAARFPSMHSRGVTSLALTTDGSRLASVSRDGDIVLWERQRSGTFQSVRTLSINTGDSLQYALAFAPDGRHLVSAGWDGTLLEWDVASGECRFVDIPETILPKETDAEGILRFTSVTYAENGTTLLAAANDGTIRAWDARTLAYQRVVGSHRDRVTSLSLCERNHTVASVSRDHTLILWQPFKRFLSQRWAPRVSHRKRISGISVSNDGTKAISTAWDGKAIVWDVASGHPDRVIATSDRGIEAQCLLPQEDRLVTADSAGQMALWDLKSGQPSPFSLPDRATNYNEYTNLARTPDGAWLFATNNDHLLEAWAIGTDARTHLFRTVDGVRCLAVTSDGARLITGSAVQEDSVIIWRITKDSLDGEDRYISRWGGVTALACARSRPVFATGHESGTTVLWSLDKRGDERELFTLSGHQGNVIAVAISDDARRIATASSDGNIRIWETIWDVPTARELVNLDKTEIGGTVSRMAFLPGGSGLLVGCEDGSIYLFGKPARFSSTAP